jgi:hypothetical protein
MMMDLGSAAADMLGLAENDFYRDAEFRLR